jgi:hypothetical protein
VEAVVFEYASVEEWVAFSEQNSGPVIMAKTAFEAAGRWTEVRERLVAEAAALNEAPDAFRITAPYLLAVVRKPD